MARAFAKHKTVTFIFRFIIEQLLIDMPARDKRSLEEIVNDVVAENTSDLLAIQSGAGMGGSIDKLVMEVMHRSKVKTDPRNIRRLILSKVV